MQRAANYYGDYEESHREDGRMQKNAADGKAALLANALGNQLQCSLTVILCCGMVGPCCRC